MKLKKLRGDLGKHPISDIPVLDTTNSASGAATVGMATRRKVILSSTVCVLFVVFTLLQTFAGSIVSTFVFFLGPDDVSAICSCEKATDASNRTTSSFIRSDGKPKPLTISLPPTAERSLVKLASVFETGRYDSYTRYSKQLTSYLALADHIFLLTAKDCAFEKLPLAWRHKCSCVNVAQFDRAYYRPGNYVPTHHARISNSHRAFVSIARIMQWKHIGVLEGDTTSFNMDEPDESSLENFKSLLLSDKWNLIRFGYRPFFLEEKQNQNQCPEECVCNQSFDGESMGGHGCVITSGACDMRSSDAYILNSKSFVEFEKLLDKFTVDMEPMQRLPRIWFTTPQLAFQVDSSQSLGIQVHWAQTFADRCTRTKGAATM